MITFRRIGSRMAVMILAIALAATGWPAMAQPQRALVIEAGMGRVLALGGPAASVFAADPPDTSGPGPMRPYSSTARAASISCISPL